MRNFFSLALILTSLYSSAQVSVYVHLDTSVHQSFTGRLFLFTSEDTVKGVPNRPDIANPEPMYSVTVDHWQGDQVIRFDDKARSFSDKLSQLKNGTYSLAAFIDANPEEMGMFNPGNYYSRKNVLLHVQNGMGEAHVYLDKEAKRTFNENDSLKEVTLRSSLLSTFRHKDIFMKAAVILPNGYDSNSDKTYPVVYFIPGWAGTHYDAQSKNMRSRVGVGAGLPKIYVYLNPETQTPYGLHAFVDSRVNGPWGKALIEEMIPYVQQHYKGTKDPQQTFVIGQSSGGYPSLWLLLNYPKSFGGGWAVSPDPVDFSNFTGMNLYDPKVNYYYHEDGSERPFFMQDGRFLTTNKKVQSIDDFFENGNQTESFEAEFGIADKNGRLKHLFDHNTGAINKNIVAEWKPYDLGLYLQEHWQELSKDLSGKKIHVYAGANDNFLLNQSVIALQKKAEKVHADIVAEIISNATHFSIWNPEFTKRVQQEIDGKITTRLNNH